MVRNMTAFRGTKGLDHAGAVAARKMGEPHRHGCCLCAARARTNELVATKTVFIASPAQQTANRLATVTTSPRQFVGEFPLRPRWLAAPVPVPEQIERFLVG